LGNSPDAYGKYNGDYGWVREGSGPVRVMWNSRLDAAKLEDTLNFAPHVNDLLSNLNVEPSEVLGGKEANVISGRTRALPLVKLYFDRESGLLVRVVYHTESVVGPVPTQIDYADYRDVDGVKVPFRWTVALVRDVHLTYQMTEVRQNVAIDESVFAKPIPPPPLY
jgi:photosynthetic reaction center cytochrome c subunit